MDLYRPETGRVMTLADAEARIAMYKEQAVLGYLGIGRTLLEAKAAHVVPHGEWERWSSEQTGLSNQQVQRLMRVAKQVHDGTAMATLDMSKALLLLSSGLDEDEREEMAKQVHDEGTSVRELQEKLKALQAEKEKAKEEGFAAGRADAQGDVLRYRELAGEMVSQVEKLTEQQQAADQQLDVLRNQLANAEQDRQQAMDKARKEAQQEAAARITELEGDLAAAEEREDERVAQLAELRRTAQTQAMDEARGVIHAEQLSGLDVTQAVRDFMGAVATLAQMGPVLAGMSAAERETIRQNVDTVANWVVNVRQAMGVYQADGSVV